MEQRIQRTKNQFTYNNLTLHVAFIYNFNAYLKSGSI
jgi:hypothetical protein